MKRISLALIFVTCAAGVLAQSAAPEMMRNDAADRLGRFLGKDLTFRAVAHTVIATNGLEIQAMDMDYAMAEGKIRSDFDLTKFHAANFPQQMIEQVKSIGMDRSVYISLPDQNRSYIIYPGKQAYVEQPLARAGPAEPSAPKIERRELGPDRIDGHPCIKTRVAMIDAAGRRSEALVWEATDLKNFPVQTQITDDGTTITTRFTNINTQKPEAAMFELPADFKRYNSVQEMMMSATPPVP
jgi:hypothetical protein